MYTIITYDLRSPGRDYNTLFEKIKSYGTCIHFHESIWLVKTSKTVTEIRDDLCHILDINDTLLVMENEESASWGSFNLGEDSYKWLNNNI